MEIEFKNVTYKENVRTPLEKTYLDNINFKITKNGIYSFVGDASSGKEKIPLLINAVNKPYMGKIKVGEFLNDGGYIKNINKLRMNISYVPMNPEDLLICKTVKEELSFGLKYFKYKLNKQDIRVVDALKLVNMSEEDLNKRVSSLSLMEKKKITIASTLIFNPNVIVLEEPWLFLKTKDRISLNNLLIKLKNKYNKTIIIISKDTDRLYEVSDKVFLLKNGKVIEEGDKGLLENEELMKSINVKTPDICKFINVSNRMNANLTFTSNILDLIKEVYRNAK